MWTSSDADIRARIGAAIAVVAVLGAAVAARAQSTGAMIAGEHLPPELAHLTVEEVARIARMSPTTDAMRLDAG